MLADKLNVCDFGEVYPQLEHILKCGFYRYSYEKESTYWSPGMYSILGLNPYEVKSDFENFLKYIQPEDKSRLLTAVKKARDEGKTYDLEFSILDARGGYKRLQAAIEIHRDEAGNLKDYGGVMRDITESYFYKKALENKVAQLDKSNRHLQEFVYVASHDLQEPLRKISTFGERLRNRCGSQLSDEGNLFLGRILNSTASMQILLEDLLAFSRLASHPANYELLSLDQCLQSVLSDLEVKIEESGAKITADPLPMIDGYPGQLKQLFSNLISNAIKFRKPGVKPRIRISSSMVRAGDFPRLELLPGVKYMTVIVSDNGIGFEEEFTERIFQIFQRLHAKAEYPGSGVGLAICKRIAENHKGAIFARSAPGEGAEFTVVLPVKQQLHDS
jgi:PAS domain S-box-containing protein